MTPQESLVRLWGMEKVFLWQCVRVGEQACVSLLENVCEREYVGKGVCVSVFEWVDENVCVSVCWTRLLSSTNPVVFLSLQLSLGSKFPYVCQQSKHNHAELQKTRQLISTARILHSRECTGLKGTRHQGPWGMYPGAWRVQITSLQLQVACLVGSQRSLFGLYNKIRKYLLSTLYVLGILLISNRSTLRSSYSHNSQK